MKKRILFVPTANAGVSWWRMVNFWTSMHRQGLAEAHVLWWKKDLTECHPWERDIHNTDYQWRITKEIGDWATRADAIVFGMLHGSGVRPDSPNAAEDYITQSLSLFRAIRDMLPETPIFTEIDDNMLSTPEYNPANPLYNPKSELREIAIRQFRESDGLIVSTPYLKEIYSDFNPNIHVVANSIDFKHWGKAANSKKARPGIRIGWAGGGSHNEDLRVMEKVIPEIVSKHKNVKFVFLHGCPEFLRGLPGVEFRAAWTRIDKYAAKIASLDFDIGLAPLVDNAFNRGKSNLRWLEYSALGIPTIAANVGHFAQTIRGGIDGLLFDTADELVQLIDSLIKDKERRRKIGAAAKERVRKDFNVDTQAAEYVRILRDATVRNVQPDYESSGYVAQGVIPAAGLIQ